MLAQHMLTALVLVAVVALAAPQQAAAASSPAPPRRVAIVGGGIGGTAAAYFLRQQHQQQQQLAAAANAGHQPSSLHIDLFEAQALGGRAAEFELDGKVYELGASIIHGCNEHVLGLAAALNLTVAPVADDDASGGGGFSVWDGSRFVFSQTGHTLSDLLAVVRRYGVTPLRYKRLASEMARRWGRIYAMQRAGRSFGTPEAWLEAVGLLDLTQLSARAFMEEHLLNRGPRLLRYGAERFIDELAAAVNRVNYNQRNAHLNALAGLVSYLPAADPRVFHLVGGNSQLAARLAAAAGVTLHVGTNISTIEVHADGSWTLTGSSSSSSTAAGAAPSSSSSSSGGLMNSLRRRLGGRRAPSEQQQQQLSGPSEQQRLGPYDAVILAAPLEGSGIELQGLRPPTTTTTATTSTPPPPPPGRRIFTTTVTSFVAGSLDARFFNQAAALPAARDVYVTDGAATALSVIASKGSISAARIAAATAARQQPRGQQQQPQQQESGASSSSSQKPDAAGGGGDGEQRVPLWKVFSSAPLGEELLRALFVNGSVLAERAWAAYPAFDPPEAFAPFVVARGLCYTSALENAASAMEVAALAGKNCALLTAQQLLQALAQQQQQQQPRTGGPEGAAAQLRRPGSEDASERLVAA